MAITKQGETFLNILANAVVEFRMTPRSSGENCYKSKYWPGLNGLVDETTTFRATPWGQKPQPQSERENILLDVIGAYDLLLLQGLTAEGASTRLGLRKSRDEMVRELDAETARRLSIQLPAPPEQPQSRANPSP